MINTDFEKVLFEAVTKEQAANDAQNNSIKAGEQAKNDKGNADGVKALSDALGLKPGQTYRPDDVIAIIKKDPKALETIASNGAVVKMLGMSADDIKSLAQSPSLTQQNVEQSTDEQPAQVQDDKYQEPILGEKANDKNWQGVVQMLSNALKAGQAPVENNGGQQ